MSLWALVELTPGRYKHSLQYLYGKGDNKPMTINAESPEELSEMELAKFIQDMFHRIVVHHVLWFREVEHQMGFHKALDILQEAYSKSYENQVKRLSKELGFGLEENNLPKPLTEMPRDKLIGLMDTIAKNWLANDGLWFLSVENKYGMNDAKRCNDSCWTRYSPFEAWSIKQFLGLSESPGLEGLRKALKFRMYSRLNVQSIIEEEENSLQFQMNICRVQETRKRKGLEDYPCKSIGLVEYGYFAESIDPRIKTKCIGCPPDPHPEEWICAWRFSIPKE